MRVEWLVYQKLMEKGTFGLYLDPNNNFQNQKEVLVLE